MKVRFTSLGVRVRLDDLELARLERGESLSVGVNWAGGGWNLTLFPDLEGVQGEAGSLRVGLGGLLTELGDPAREGVQLAGPPRVDIEKDFGPQHA